MGAVRYVCSVYVIKTSVSLKRHRCHLQNKYKLTKIFIMYVFSILFFTSIFPFITSTLLYPLLFCLYIFSIKRYNFKRSNTGKALSFSICTIY